jgi:hypothetical protein
MYIARTRGHAGPGCEAIPTHVHTTFPLAPTRRTDGWMLACRIAELENLTRRIAGLRVAGSERAWKEAVEVTLYCRRVDAASANGRTKDSLLQADLTLQPCLA